MGEARGFTAKQQASYVEHAEPKALLVYEGLKEIVFAAVELSVRMVLKKKSSTSMRI